MKIKAAVAVTTFFFLIVTSCSAQGVNIKPTKIPPFKIWLANNQIFKAQDLPRGKPVIVIYFSIDCNHCKTLAENLCRMENKFKKATIVMISFCSTAEIGNFSKKYNLFKFSNIVVGTDGSGTLVRSYYNINNTPFIALHDSLGNFISSFAYNKIDLNELVRQINNIK